MKDFDEVQADAFKALKTVTFKTRASSLKIPEGVVIGVHPTEDGKGYYLGVDEPKYPKIMLDRIITSKTLLEEALASKKFKKIGKRKAMVRQRPLNKFEFESLSSQRNTAMKNSRPRKVANAAEAQRILKQNGYIGEPNEGRTPDGYEIQNKAEIRKRAGYRVERVYGKNGKVDIYVYDKGVKKPICHLTYTSKSKATASIKTERKAETAKSQKVRVGTCTPYKLSISEGQFKKIVSGGKTVKIRGDRPFFIGRGPNAKGKDKYWFAWFRKGKTMFFPIDDGQAKELVGMAKPAGETREFKTPGWQQLASTKKKPAK